MPCTVELRGAAHDLLHRAVDEGLPELRRARAASDRSLPAWVTREVERFQLCGDPKAGFAWLWCKPCDHHRLVPFSCKGRGFCPTCCGRRMNATAARWTDTLFPRVPVRQWVLTIPWKHRRVLARRPKLARGVLAIALRIAGDWYRARTGAPDGETGTVSVEQRFGSALNLNLHFHVLALDGVFVRDGQGRLTFRQATPHQADVERLVAAIAEACEASLSRQGVGDDDEREEDPDDAQGLLLAASAGGWTAVTGRPVRKVQVLGGREVPLPPRCASCDGYNLHAGVAVKGSDRGGLERLARYVLRPPLAKERLVRREDGSVEVGMKRTWSDGTRAVAFTPAELTERLCALVPPPYANQILYHGVFAARHKWREEVVPEPPKRETKAKLTRAAVVKVVERREPAWAELLWRVFRDDGWACPSCGAPMRLRCVKLGPATRKVLTGLRATGPP